MAQVSEPRTTAPAAPANIQDVFNEYGVQIMTPAYEGDPGEPKVVSPDRWFTAPAVPSRTPEVYTPTQARQD